MWSMMNHMITCSYSSWSSIEPPRHLSHSTRNATRLVYNLFTDHDWAYRVHLHNRLFSTNFMNQKVWVNYFMSAVIDDRYAAWFFYYPSTRHTHIPSCRSFSRRIPTKKKIQNMRDVQHDEVFFVGSTLATVIKLTICIVHTRYILHAIR